MQRIPAAIHHDQSRPSRLIGLALMLVPCALLAAQGDSGLSEALRARPATTATAVPALVLNPAEWLVQRDASGIVVLHAVVPGTQLRDLSQPGWRIESDLVSGTMAAVPTLPGSDQRDERREPVLLADGAAAQLALMAPAAAARVWISLPPSGRKPGANPRRVAPAVPRDEHGFIVPPSSSTRPMIAPLIPGFPTH